MKKAEKYSPSFLKVTGQVVQPWWTSVHHNVFEPIFQTLNFDDSLDFLGRGVLLTTNILLCLF